MQTYWKDYYGADPDLWEHEWGNLLTSAMTKECLPSGKHGTCISTLEPACFSNYVPQQEVIAYFNRTVELFKTLPTHKWLAEAGIIPSMTETYTASEILTALNDRAGALPTISCKYGQLNEVWYYFNFLGSLLDGKFIPSDPDGAKSTCPPFGIRYLPKTPYNQPLPKPPHGPPGKPKGRAFVGRGTLQVKQGGCLISSGKWYKSGTCATFTAHPVIARDPATSPAVSDDSIGFTLSSSRGQCSIDPDDDRFVCARDLPTNGTIFHHYTNGDDNDDDPDSFILDPKYGFSTNKWIGKFEQGLVYRGRDKRFPLVVEWHGR